MKRNTACWLAQHDPETPCEGRTQRCHLIKEQTLKRHFPVGSRVRCGGKRYVVQASEAQARKRRALTTDTADPGIVQSRLTWDPRIIVAGCERHHARLDRCLAHLSRDCLPVDAEEYAADHGLEWLLDRTYGARRPGLADGTATRGAAHETLVNDEGDAWQHQTN